MKVDFTTMLMIILSLILASMAYSTTIKLDKKIADLEYEIKCLNNKCQILNKKCVKLNHELCIHDFPLDFETGKQNK